MKYGLLFVLLLLTACEKTSNVEIQFQPELDFNYRENEHLNYRVSGNSDKLALIFIHGFGASLRTWDELVPLISSQETYQIFIDLKGAGFSSKPQDSDYSVAAQASLVSAFITANNIKDYVLIGHSLGGAISIISTLQNQQDNLPPPRGLILLDPGIYKIQLPFFISDLRDPIKDTLIHALTTANYRARYVLEKIYFDSRKVTNETIARYAFFMGLPGQHEALVQSAKQILPDDHDDFLKRMKTIPVPTQIIWGEQDTVVPLETGKRLSQDLPDARLNIISDCGHNIQEECPLPVARIINDYLAEIQNPMSANTSVR